MNHFQIIIGAQSYSLEVKGSRVSVFKTGNEKPFLEFNKTTSELKGARKDGFWQLLIDGNYFQGSLEKVKTQHHEEFDGNITSSGAGRVTKLHVKPGQKVEKEEVLCTIEAMKMEYPIATPAAGVVESILVKVGDQVERGNVLIKITPS